MNYIEELKKKDAELGTVSRHVFHGEKGRDDEQAVAREILSGIWQIERGHAVVCKGDFGDPNRLEKLRALFWRTLDRVRNVKNPYRKS